jgi:integration host factor subunit beta
VSKKKADLIETTADKLRLPHIRTEALVNEIFNCMTAALAAGEDIAIRGFGFFSVKSYDAYEGRNPRTGERVHVGPKRVAAFKAGKDLAARVDRGRQNGRILEDE